VIEALKGANAEVGGSVLELGEAEYMVRSSGYLKSLEDFRDTPLAVSEAGVPCGSATSRAYRSARKCAAVSPSSTGKAK